MSDPMQVDSTAVAIALTIALTLHCSSKQQMTSWHLLLELSAPVHVGETICFFTILATKEMQCKKWLLLCIRTTL